MSFFCHAGPASCITLKLLRADKTQAVLKHWKQPAGGLAVYLDVGFRKDLYPVAKVYCVICTKS